MQGMLIFIEVVFITALAAVFVFYFVMRRRLLKKKELSLASDKGKQNSRQIG